ncbi:MAG: hypothetical protein WBC19_10920, partial [Pyrinomonadaceae bacterium]
VRRALSVFIRTTRPFLRPASASLSASAPSVPSSGFPLLLLSNGHVTASVPPLGAGQSSLSNLDCETSLHPKNPKSSRKHFNYCPYVTGFLWKSCGFACAKNVDKIVENPASGLHVFTYDLPKNFGWKNAGPRIKIKYFLFTG